MTKTAILTINDIPVEVSHSDPETSFHPRTYIVAMDEKKFTPLNGAYSSLEDIKHQIDSLCVQDIARTTTVAMEKVQRRYVWRCPKCCAYGVTSDGINAINQISHEEPEMCHNCQFDPSFSRSHWRSIVIYPKLSVVGIRDYDNKFLISELECK